MIFPIFSLTISKLEIFCASHNAPMIYVSVKLRSAKDGVENFVQIHMGTIIESLLRKCKILHTKFASIGPVDQRVDQSIIGVKLCSV